jgi:RNA polymerase sigma factor (TIGR02999 family)
VPARTPDPLIPSASPPDSLNAYFESLYRELHSLAHQQLRRGAGPATLDTTALVHEVYLRFADADQLAISDRRHFLAYAATTMRSVVVDIMRARCADKRGAGAGSLTLNTEVADAAAATPEDVVRIHEALLELSSVDPMLVQVVEMRYFAGLNEDEIADAMQLSARTVRRHWQKARIFLRASMTAP